MQVSSCRFETINLPNKSKGSFDSVQVFDGDFLGDVIPKIVVLSDELFDPSPYSVESELSPWERSLNQILILDTHYLILSISSCSTSIAASAITVPGPKMAVTPASYRY